MSGDGGAEGCLDHQVWVRRQGEAPKGLGNVNQPWARGLSGSPQAQEAVDKASICLPRHTCMISVLPLELAGWAADRLEQALSPGVMSTAPTQGRLLCGGWQPLVHTLSPEGSQAELFLRRPTDSLHPWLPGMEKLRGGRGGKVLL